MFQAVQQVPVKDEPMSAEGWVLVITVLMIMLAIAWYVVSKFRSIYYDTTPEPGSYLGTFQELREQGVLEENEYRKLKETLTGNTARSNESINRQSTKSAMAPTMNEPPVEFETATGPESDQRDMDE